MSTYRLDKLFAPRSVALVGASHRDGSLGRIILRNLREGGFPGVIHLINPRYAEIDGVACVPRIEDLPDVPDLVVITAPPPTVPGVVAAAGARGLQQRSSSRPASATGRGRSPMEHGWKHASTGCAWWGRTASAFSRQEPSSTPALRRAAPRPAIWR